MKALVTGATGFLGRFLVDRLVQLGFQLTATGRNKQVGQQFDKAQITFIPADLRDSEAMIALCKDQEIVFHCGALSAPWGRVQTFYETNYLGTKYIIEGCKKHQVNRLIYVSSPSIYTQIKDQLQLTEHDPIPKKKINAYAETKWLGEQAIDEAYNEGLPVITIRPRAIFGPGDQAILPRLLQVYQRGAIPLINEGKSKIDITYVSNVVDALILCATAPTHTFGKKYNITNDHPMYLIDLLQMLFKELQLPLKTKKTPFSFAYLAAGTMEIGYQMFAPHQEPPFTRYSITVIGKSQTFDITAAKKELGYHPKVSIEEGFSQFATWWRKQN